MTDTERLDWLESQSAGRGWNVGPRSEGWPLTIVTRGPFASLRQAIDKAAESEKNRMVEQSAACPNENISEIHR